MNIVDRINFMTEAAVPKARLQKYKAQYREAENKFYGSPAFPEGAFRCHHLKNKPSVNKEICIRRQANPSMFDKCVGCPKKEDK